MLCFSVKQFLSPAPPLTLPTTTPSMHRWHVSRHLTTDGAQVRSIKLALYTAYNQCSDFQSLLSIVIVILVMLPMPLNILGLRGFDPLPVSNILYLCVLPGLFTRFVFSTICLRPFKLTSDLILFIDTNSASCLVDIPPGLF